MPRAPVRLLTPVGVMAAPAAAALVAFAPALRGGFVHDDVPQIVGNPLVRHLGFLPQLWSTGVWAGAGSGSSFFRPVFTTSIALDVAAFGSSPVALHATQLALAALAAALLARLAWRVEGDAGLALAAGLLFAVHPVNAEAAAWISARPDLLAAIFLLLALASHGAALRARAPAPTLRWTVASGLCVFLALCSKESALGGVPTLLALERASGAPLRPAALASRWAPIAAAGLAAAALRTRALGGLSGGITGAVDPAALAGAAGQGALRLVWPAGLSISPLAPTPGDVALGGALAFAGAAGLALAWARRARLLVPLTLFLGTLALGALGAARIGEMADRYLLLPSAAGAWLAARAGRALPAASRKPALAVVVLGFAALASRHTRVFESDERLWSDAFRSNPASVRAALNLATARIEAGNPRAALPLLDHAALLSPDDPQVTLNRAVAAEALGDSAEARRLLAGLVAAEPGYWAAQLRLGHLALERGDLDEAAGRYDTTLRLYALSPEAWAGLGVVRARQGRTAEARAALARALALDPEVQNADALRRILRDLPE